MRYWRKTTLLLDCVCLFDGKARIYGNRILLVILFSIHVIGLKYRFTEHPDSRAQMFEPKKYGARKVKNLCLALDGMEDLFKLLNYFNKIKGDFEEM